MEQQSEGIIQWVKKRKIVTSVLVTLTLIIGIMIGSVISGRVSAMRTFSFAGTNATPLAVPDPIPSSNSFSGIVNRVEPAVVNIATTQVMEHRAPSARRKRSQPDDQDDPMQDFFDKFFDGQKEGPAQAERSL